MSNVSLLAAINLTDVLQGIPDGIILFAPDQSILFANAEAALLTGLPQEGFYLAELFRLLKGKVSVNVEDAVRAVLQEGVPMHLKDVQVISFFYDFFITPVQDSDKKIIGGIITMHDVTDRVELDQRKSEFVSLASHQLRTPLSIINWYVEMLVAGDVGPLTPLQKEHLDEVYKGSTRMAKLVNDLLNLSRLETGRLAIAPVPTDLVALMKNINNEVGQLAKARNCALVVEEPIPPLPEILVDPELLRQVLSNVIMNAIRYSPPEKKCTVAISFQQSKVDSLKIDENLKSEIQNLKSGDYVVIAVQDQGIGIPKDAQPRVFGKFFRADNARTMEAEGSGLGLYIAKLILEASGGMIWFSSPGGSPPEDGRSALGGESSENPGTTFYVAIPMAGMKEKAGEKGLAR